MTKSIISVKHIDMYCRILREKMWKKISDARIGDEESLKQIKLNVNEMYGIDKLEKLRSKLIIKRDKHYKKLSEEIDNIYKRIYEVTNNNKINEQIKERYNACCLATVLQQQMSDLETEIRLSTCPEEIKEIFKKLDE